MRDAIIIGSGGHCRVILSIISMAQSHRVKKIIDITTPWPGEKIMGINVVSHQVNLMNELCGVDNLDFFIAIGDVATRRMWWEKLDGLGLSLPSLISPSSNIDPTATLGRGNVICANSFIGPYASLGNNNLVNTGAIIEHEAILNDHCHVGPGSIIAGRTHLSNQCFIGAGATVIDRLSVAQGTTVGAGSVVIADILKQNTVIVGVPAKER